MWGYVVFKTTLCPKGRMILTMTNLTRFGYDHFGFLNAHYVDFVANERNRFAFSVSQPTLEISSWCAVGIFPSASPSQVVVEIDADEEDLKHFRVHQQGNTIVIEHTSPSGGGGNVIIGDVVMGGGSVRMSGVNISGGNTNMYVNGQHIQVINGRTFVNGVLIDGGQAQKPRREPKIRVYAPQMSNLEASMNGSGVLVSAVPFQLADVEVKGQSTVGLGAYELDFRVKGQGDSFVIIGGGKLELQLSGQGNANIQGTWSEARVSVSGMGNVRSTGNCEGDYRASVSGMGSISHTGEVAGRVKKSVSGMGSINI
jgi:hypothetical protein